MPSSSKPLTERQRFWRKHLRCCRAADQSIAAYAAANDLSPFCLYDANRQMRLAQAKRSQPVVATPEPGSSVATAATAPCFVRVSAPASATLPCRAHLRNGVIVEVGINAGEFGAVLRDLAQLP